MIITKLETFNLDRTVLVRITTDEGFMGWGECSPMRPQLICENVMTFGESILGRNPFDIESIVGDLFLKNYKNAGQSLAIAISGIDIALWDIMGKALKQPVYNLLGGCVRKKIPVYASSMRRDITPEEESRRFVTLIEKYGFQAVKTRIGKLFDINGDESPGRTRKMIQVLRKDLGDSIDIMADANGAYTPAYAIKVGRFLEDYGVFHYEEPCLSYNLDDTAIVAAALDIPVAGGEQDWNPYTFRQMLEKRSVDIIQPDIIKAGGLLNTKKIANLASVFGVPITLHNAKPNIGTIASLHFAASTPMCCFPQEWSIEPYPLQGKVITPSPEVVDGHIIVPEGPGLGVEVLESILKQATRRFVALEKGGDISHG